VKRGVLQGGLRLEDSSGQRRTKCQKHGPSHSKAWLPPTRSGPQYDGAVVRKPAAHTTGTYKEGAMKGSIMLASWGEG